ncbi:hypothetical protein RhiirB3_450483 [Rhizophagus irregularis]|nr:hypothetical protein RhiirB3_450483 [Rhizophagus irregularis]
MTPLPPKILQDGLDFNLLIKERERHDAYNSHSILRRFKTSSSQITTNQNAIQPNKASHILSYFVKNDYQEERFILQRTNRWKSALPNIENANISEDFPLAQEHFILCFYGKQICVGQVQALYYELYGNHSFNTKHVTKIEDISKVTLKIFIPTDLELKEMEHKSVDPDSDLRLKINQELSTSNKENNTFA